MIEWFDSTFTDLQGALIGLIVGMTVGAAVVVWLFRVK